MSGRLQSNGVVCVLHVARKPRPGLEGMVEVFSFICITIAANADDSFPDRSEQGQYHSEHQCQTFNLTSQNCYLQDLQMNQLVKLLQLHVLFYQPTHKTPLKISPQRQQTTQYFSANNNCMPSESRLLSQAEKEGKWHAISPLLNNSPTFAASIPNDNRRGDPQAIP